MTFAPPDSRFLNSFYMPTGHDPPQQSQACPAHRNYRGLKYPILVTTDPTLRQTKSSY